MLSLLSFFTYWGYAYLLTKYAFSKRYLEKLVDLYSDYLLCSQVYVQGQVSCTVLSSILEGKISHDKFTRMLHSGVVSSWYMWLTDMPLCKLVESDDVVLILHNSVEAKPFSHCNSLISFHFDHTVGKRIKGLNYLSALYHSNKTNLPVGIEFIFKDKGCEQMMNTRYKKRWKVEEYHKSLKSNCSFPKSLTCSVVAQKSHFVSCMLAFI